MPNPLAGPDFFLKTFIWKHLYYYTEHLNFYKNFICKKRKKKREKNTKRKNKKKEKKIREKNEKHFKQANGKQANKQTAHPRVFGFYSREGV